MALSSYVTKQKPPLDPNATTATTLFGVSRPTTTPTATDPATDPNAPPVYADPTNQPPPVTNPTEPNPYSFKAPWGKTPTDQLDVDSYGVPQYATTRFGAAPSGWDPTKWADPTHQTPKYVWGGIYEANRATGDPNWMQNAVNQFMQAYPGTTYAGKDVIMTPWGEEVDLFRDFGGENGISWMVHGAPAGPVAGLPALTSTAQPFTGSGGSAAPTSLAGVTRTGRVSDGSIYPQGWVELSNGNWVPPDHPDAQAAAGGAAGGGATTSTTSATSTTTQSNPLADRYREEILKLLTPQTIDGDELRRSPEAIAQRVAAARAMERDRAQLAEETAYGGEGNFAGRVRQMGQARSDAEVQFIGQLAQQKMLENRERLFMGLQLAMRDGEFEKAQALERELAALNAQIQREGISADRDISGADIASRGQIANRGMDIDLQRLAQEWSQFNRSLGYDYTALQLGANRDAVIRAMEGY